MVVGSSSSSSSSSVSSLTSFGGSSDEAVAAVRGPVVKFLCSHGGKILPRHHDGRLRYVGGDTRVLAVDRAVPFSELAVKMAELCGWGVPVSVRCQLPTEDLDALVSVTSDEDLANLLEEYDLASRDRDSPLKVKAFLAPQQQHHHHHPAPVKASATPPSAAVRGKSPFGPSAGDRCAHHVHGHLPQQIPCAAASSSRLPTRPPAAMCYGQQPQHYRHEQHHHRACVLHGGAGGGAGAATSYRYHNHQQHPHLIHHGNHWQ